MTLKISNFYVEEVRLGTVTQFDGHVLTIDKEAAIRFLMDSDCHITDVDILIARPGDDTRIVPVKEAVEIRFRPDGRALFPGITGDLAACGEGELYALKGCSILGVGKHWGSFGDGLIDMGGIGADLTIFSKLINICLVIDTDEEFERHEQQKQNHAIRWATHRFAEYLGKVLQGKTATDHEDICFTPLGKREASMFQLPSIVLVMQAQSQMEDLGYNALLYGWDMNRYLPSFISPTEILDGAILSGSFMPSSSKWSTYDFQNFPTIKELLKKHGTELNFLGIILSNLNVSLEQKERSAIMVVNMAKTLGADGAIVTEEGYGNPDADYVKCLIKLKKAGIQAVGISNECTGRDGMSQPLVVMDPELDALVSTGNVSQLIELPPCKTVIGELQALSRDGLSGGWSFDENLGPSIRNDGSIILENNAMFCGDQVAGWSRKMMKEF